MVVANEARSAELALAIIILYPTRASGIIVLLKTPTKYREFLPTISVKTTNFQLVFNFEQTRTVTIFGEHGIMAHIPWWLSLNQSSRIALSNYSVFNNLCYFAENSSIFIYRKELCLLAVSAKLLLVDLKLQQKQPTYYRYHLHVCLRLIRKLHEEDRSKRWWIVMAPRPILGKPHVW